MRDGTLLTHNVVVLHRFIIRSSDAVVKPGYSDLFEGCAFFLYGGYFIIALPNLPPWVKKSKPTGLMISKNLFDTDPMVWTTLDGVPPF